MKSNFEDVLEFHEKFELPVRKCAIPLVGPVEHPLFRDAMWHLQQAEKKLQHLRGSHEDDEIAGRCQMMIEEVREFMEHANMGYLPEQFDSLLDLAYFVFGTAVQMGLPWQMGWEAVHVANMAKVRARSASESKRGNKFDVIKPEGWRPPNLGLVILQAQLGDNYAGIGADQETAPPSGGAPVGRVAGDRGETGAGDGDSSPEPQGSDDGVPGEESSLSGT